MIFRKKSKEDKESSERVLDEANDIKETKEIAEEVKYLEPWNYKDKDEYLSLLDQLGWFNFLPSEAKEIVREGLESRSLDEYPFHSHSFHYDAECIYDEGDHIKIIEGISKVSFGQFIPVEINEKWEKNDKGLNIQVCIQTSMKKYEASWLYECDYLASEFYTFIDSVIRDHTKDLCLKSLPGGQDGYFIVCNNEAFKQAVLHKIMPWELHLDFLDTVGS